MTEILQLRVDGTRLSIEELPAHVHEDRVQDEAQAICAVTFDEGWDGFSRTLLLRHRGEAPFAVRLKPVGKKTPSGADERVAACMLPKPFLDDDRPILLTVEGAGHGITCRLRTNDVCAALRPGLQGEKRIICYEGPYTLRENKTYPFANTFLPQDLVVDVPTVDFTKDTVTPETLLQGITAHNAAGEPITGKLGGLNLVCSERAPQDTGKLWVKTNMQPKTVTVDDIRPVWTPFSIQGKALRTQILLWIPAPTGAPAGAPSGGLCAYGVERTGDGYRPQLLRFSPDGTASILASGKRVFPTLPDALPLDGCVGERFSYLLLGASGAGSACRSVRLYQFALETASGQVVRTVDAAGYRALSGGVTQTEDGSVFLYTNACDSPGGRRIFRAYRVWREELFPLGEGTVCGENGDGGMARIGNFAYTSVHGEDGDAVLLHLPSGTLERWHIGSGEKALRIEGVSNGMLHLRYPHGLRLLRPQTGEGAKVNLFTGGGDASEKRIYRAWTESGESIFAVSTDRGVPQYAKLPQKAPCGTLRLCTGTEEGVRLPLYRVQGQTLYAAVAGAFVSDANGVWQFAEVYHHDGTAWKRAVPK